MMQREQIAHLMGCQSPKYPSTGSPLGYPPLYRQQVHRATQKWGQLMHRQQGWVGGGGGLLHHHCYMSLHSGLHLRKGVKRHILPRGLQLQPYSPKDHIELSPGSHLLANGGAWVARVRSHI